MNDALLCFDVLLVCRYCRSYKFFNRDLTYLMLNCSHSCSSCKNTTHEPAEHFFIVFTQLANALLNIRDLKDLTLNKIFFTDFDTLIPGVVDVAQIEERFLPGILKKNLQPAGFGISGLSFACSKCGKETVFKVNDLHDISKKPPRICPECGSRVRGQRWMKEVLQSFLSYDNVARALNLSGFALVPISTGNNVFDWERENIRTAGHL